MGAIHGLDSGRVTFADGMQLDAGSRLRVSTPHSLFESKHVHGRDPLLWQERLEGAIIVHAGEVGGTGLQVGETFTGGTSGKQGVITAKTATTVTYTTKDNDFTDGETCTGAVSGTTFVVSTHDTGAHIAYNYSKASVSLQVGTVAGQRVIRQTQRYFPYAAGFSQLVQATGTFDTPKANCKFTLLYGDDLDGLGWQVDGTTLYLLARSSASGVVVETRVPQSEWNLDRLNSDYGLNPSGVQLDATKSQIGGIDFLWLGIGRVRMFFNIDGHNIAVHEFLHSNRESGVYMHTPSLPIRYEIENTGETSGASEIEQICSSVSSEGGVLVPGAGFAVGTGWTQQRTVTVRTPVLALRLKSAWPAGKPNRKQVRILDFGTFARTNDCLLELMHVHNPLTMTASWINVDGSGSDDSSGCEYSVDISALTADHMHRVDQVCVPAGQGQTGTVVDSAIHALNAHTWLSQNLESDNSDMFVLYATSRTGDSVVMPRLSFIELE